MASKRQLPSRDGDLVPKYYTRRWVLSAHACDLLTLNTLFMERWEIYAKLGQGAHGEVYAAYDRNLDKDVAIKACKNRLSMNMEVEIMRKFTNLEHFCSYIFHDMRYEIPYLVMDMKGPTVRQMITCFMPLSMSTIMNLALQMLDALQVFHKNCFVHNDIKSNNFVLGMPPDDASTVYLVDFSLARRFDPSISNRAQNRSQNIKGGTAFGFTANQSRREDVTRLLYMLLEMKMDPPWAHERDILVIKEKRLKSQDLLRNYLGPEFVEFKKYLENLKVFEAPNYDQLRTFLNKAVENQKLDLNKKTEWEANPNRFWKITYVKSYRRGMDTDYLYRNKSSPVLPASESHDNDIKIAERIRLQDTDKPPSSNSCKTSSPMLPLLPIPDDISKVSRSKSKLYPRKPEKQLKLSGKSQSYPKIAPRNGLSIYAISSSTTEIMSTQQSENEQNPDCTSRARLNSIELRPSNFRNMDFYKALVDQFAPCPIIDSTAGPSAAKRNKVAANSSTIDNASSLSPRRKSSKIPRPSKSNFSSDKYVKKPNKKKD